MTLREFLHNSPPPNQTAFITAFIGVSLLGNIEIEHGNETKDSVAGEEMLPQCGSRNPCLPKCCPLNTLVTFSDGNANLECLETFNNTTRFKSTTHQFLQASSLSRHLQYSKNRFLEESKNLSNPNKVNGVIQNVSTLKPLCYRLEEDGTLFYLKHFTWIRVPVANYCMDGFQFSSNQPIQFSRSDENFGFLIDIDDGDRTRRTDNKYDATLWRPLMLCVASIFLLLTFLVHVLLWQDQNIHGWIAMSSSVTMFLMYCFNALALFLDLAKRSDGSRTSVLCTLVGILMHFFSLSNFCWLTGMCFSLFWTFRKITPNNQHGRIVVQYLLYAGFGWGLPILLIMVSAILDQTYSDDHPCNTFTLPEYGVEFCSIYTGALGPYLIYPVALLLLLNLVCFAFISGKFYSYQKNTAIARQNSAESHQLFMLITKLFFVMGLTWIVEILPWYFDVLNVNWYWGISDVFIWLQAIAIFVTYICKSSIATSLGKKYHILKPLLKISELERRKKSTEVTDLRGKSKSSNAEEEQLLPKDAN